MLGSGAAAMNRTRALALALALAPLACGAEAPPPAHTPERPTPPPAALGAAIAQAVANAEDVAIPVGEGDAVRGGKDALATVVVFSDFECPACRALARRLDPILARFPESDVRFVFKNYPLRQHPHARLAAEVGQGVLATKGPAAFFRYHDAIFGRTGKLDRELVMRAVEEAGADGALVASGLEARAWQEKIDRDLALGSALHIAGTPTIYVNGVDVEDENELVRALERQIARGKALVANGTPRTRVYATLVAENRPKEDPRPPREEEERAPPKVDPTVWRVPVGTSPVRGFAHALVTVVAMSDFACPFCKRAEPTLDRLRKEYGDKVRVVWKDTPLASHERARPAALLARAARAQKGDAGFWDVHDRLFAASALADADLERIAREAGLDVPKAMAFVKANAPNKDLERDDDLAEEVSASGTPHFFVNGRRLVGALPYATFAALVEEELVKAEALVKEGKVPSAVYDSIVAQGRVAPEPDRKTVTVPKDAPSRGAPGAKVVVQVFSDYQCPYCRRVEPTVDALLAAYPGKVKVVWRDLPLGMHPDAPLAAEAAREAWAQKGEAGWNKMRAKLFENQGIVSGLKRESLDQMAKEAGLDVARFGRALDGRVHKAAVEADAKAADEAGVSGTPGFLVGSYYVSGAKPLRTFRRWVERSLGEDGKGGKK